MNDKKYLIISIGASGSNVMKYFVDTLGIEDVPYIVCDTDLDALAGLTDIGSTNILQLGPKFAQGVGTGCNPADGLEACNESKNEIIHSIQKHAPDLIFIVTGLGGGIGSSAGPFIAEICQELGITTVGIVTLPFLYEGKKRREQAHEAIKAMEENTNTVLIISQEGLRQQYGNMPFTQAFQGTTKMVAYTIATLIDALNSHDKDIYKLLQTGGNAAIGIAKDSEECRGTLGIKEAFASPIFDTEIMRTASHIIFHIAASKGKHSLKVGEVKAIAFYLQEEIDSKINTTLIITHDDSLGEEARIILIAL